MSTLQNLIDTKQTGLVMFYGTACPPCQQMKPRMAALTAKLGMNLHLVNVTSEMSFVKQNGIRGVPTLYAIKDGEMKFLVTGGVGDLRVEELLEQAGMKPQGV